MSYCALPGRHRERVSFQERKRILVLSLLFIILLGIILGFGINRAFASQFEISASDNREILELAEQQNRYLKNLSRLFVSDEGNGSPSLMYSLMDEENAIGKIGKKVCMATGMILILAYAGIQLIQMAQREDESLETIMRILLTCIIGYFLVIYVEDIMAGIEGLGNTIYSAISTAADKLDSGQTLQEAMSGTGGSISASGFSLEGNADTSEAAANAINNVSKLINGGVAGFIGAILMYFTFYTILTSAYGLVFELVIRKIFAPIAMADFVTEGFRSPGARYLKNYLGVYIRISIFCIVIILGFCASVWAVQNKEVSSVMGSGIMTRGIGATGAIYCIRFAMKALMNASGQITKEMLGG